MRVLALLALALALILAACSGPAATSGNAGGADSSLSDSSASATATALDWAAPPPSAWTGSSIRVAELPPEAIETLGLIVAGGPFPYRQDGSTFQNREGILPDRPSGSYREYTVDTPGSPDRGARRLVVDAELVAYYTDDHYDSFQVVVP